MMYGYARCSTSEDKQDIQRQIRELKAAGAEEVIFEYEHGDSKVKKQQTLMLERQVTAALADHAEANGMTSFYNEAGFFCVKLK